MAQSAQKRACFGNINICPGLRKMGGVEAELEMSEFLLSGFYCDVCVREPAKTEVQCEVWTLSGWKINLLKW